LFLPSDARRRDGRVAEGARLESVFTRKGNVGSNPTLSASSSKPSRLKGLSRDGKKLQQKSLIFSTF
jgi:hypothetical protein